MRLTPGTRLGVYEIEAALGSGGMGEVYRARDTRLGRAVAIKILPRELAAEPERLMRFDREARVLAALNHAHIATIHGVEEADGVSALVMELVDGQTLAQRIARGRLPAAQALRIAREIAAALEAAHEKGIVHRDLKPSNVMILPGGAVKVLDFGLAKIGATDADDADLSRTRHATRDHSILGTAAYMSPEQARGLGVDKRTDIWAFGCVLYELLTGRRAFDGATETDTLAAVLEREPDWKLLPHSTPDAVVALLRRCLRKDPAQRLRDIGDIRLALDDIERVPPTVAGSAPAAGSRRLVTWLAALALVAAGAVGGAYLRRPAPQPVEAMRTSIFTPGAVEPQLSATISPNGRQVAFVATDGPGRLMLWVRALAELDARVLPGTEGALHPFWSPDGSALGFVADGKLKVTDASGGTVRTLADTSRGGGAWNQEGVILFTTSFSSGLLRIPSTGGTPVPVTSLDASRREVTHAWPQFLPDGRHFLYFVQSPDPEHRGVYVGSLDAPQGEMLIATDHQAIHAEPGYLLFMRDESLMAQPFDAATRKLSGDPALVAQGIWTARGAGRAAFSASTNGTLAYMNAALWNSQLAWFDRRGELLSLVGPPDRYRGQVPQLAPGGERAAIAVGHWSAEQIWMIDTVDGRRTRLTFDALQSTNPIWSADGRRIMFTSRDSDDAGFYVAMKEADGAGRAERLFDGPLIRALDWSPDGRFVVTFVPTPGGLADLWRVSLESGESVAFLDSAAAEYQADISPDGRWIAYVSNESGIEEVYLESFPELGNKRQVSTRGGNQPRWRADGGELYYMDLDRRLVAVPLTVRATALEIGNSTPLFLTRLQVVGYASAAVDRVYDVSPDGQRFLMNMLPTDLGPPITIVTNWPAALTSP